MSFILIYNDLFSFLFKMIILVSESIGSFFFIYSTHFYDCASFYSMLLDVDVIILTNWMLLSLSLLLLRETMIIPA